MPHNDMHSGPKLALPDKPTQKNLQKMIKSTLTKYIHLHGLHGPNCLTLMGGPLQLACFKAHRFGYSMPFLAHTNPVRSSPGLQISLQIHEGSPYESMMHLCFAGQVNEPQGSFLPVEKEKVECSF